jgi:hypothetical protein
VDFQKLRERKQQTKNEPVVVGADGDDLNPPF